MLRRNPNYSGPRPRQLEAIEVRIGEAPERAVADVEAGRADYAQAIPPEARARLLTRYGPGSDAASAGRQQYFTGPVPGVQALVFNPRRPLFAEARMRRAANLAINRRALVAVSFEASGRPTDQHIPPGYPGFQDARIYPLGAPDIATARRLTGGTRRRGILHTCNTPDCIARAEIVRANLAAIGIELEIRRLSFRQLFAVLLDPDEPYDASFFGWFADTGDPSQFIDVMFDQTASTSFLDRTRLGERMREAGRLEGSARIEAYAALDRDLAAEEAPFAPYSSNLHTDFFSARIGCQVEHPIYGIDVAALCLRK